MNTKTRGKMVVATLLAAVVAMLMVPAALAGGNVTDVSGTSWVGTGTLVMKVAGHGKKTAEYECMVMFDESGAFDFACKELGPHAMEATSTDTWSQKGKRVHITFTDMRMVASDLAWVYEDVFEIAMVEDVPVTKVKSSAKVKTKKDRLTWKWKEWGKVVDANGKTRKVSLKIKVRNMEQNVE